MSVENTSRDSTDCTPAVDFSEARKTPGVHRNQIRQLINRLDIPTDAYRISYSDISNVTRLYIHIDEANGKFSTHDLEMCNIDSDDYKVRCWFEDDPYIVVQLYK
jgi:hypothetical protein